MSTTASYLTTLRRIPDDIVLSMATRDLEPADGAKCICAWAMRESLARAANMDADDTTAGVLYIERHCAEQFGGTEREWSRVFWDIAEDTKVAKVERAFVTRVMEAAGVEVAR